jgi:hypothetical protein
MRPTTVRAALAAALALGGCGGGSLGGPPAVTGAAGAGGVPGVMYCAAVNTPIVHTLPEILLVLERAVPASVTSAISTLVSATDSQVVWGLELFGDPSTGCDVVDGIVVPPGPNQAGAIEMELAGLGSGTNAGTSLPPSPVRAAEAAGAAYLASRTDASPKYLMLVTNGQPTCPAASTDAGADPLNDAVTAVAAARDAGTPTFVVGPDPPAVAATALAALAIAGGMMPTDGTPCYTPRTIGALEIAVGSSVRPTVACAFTLSPPTNLVSNEYIDVFVDGTLIPKDATHNNGWDYVDPSLTGIEIYGATCDAILGGSVMTLAVRYRCTLP